MRAHIGCTYEIACIRVRDILLSQGLRDHLRLADSHCIELSIQLALKDFLGIFVRLSMPDNEDSDIAHDVSDEASRRILTVVCAIKVHRRNETVSSTFELKHY